MELIASTGQSPQLEPGQSEGPFHFAKPGLNLLVLFSRLAERFGPHQGPGMIAGGFVHVRQDPACR